MTLDDHNRRADDPRINKLVSDVDNLKAEMVKNTEVTTQVRDILTSFRIMATIAKWFAAITAGVVAVKTGMASFGK